MKEQLWITLCINRVYTVYNENIDTRDLFISTIEIDNL
jgi:hypothetical protein